MTRSLFTRAGAALCIVCALMASCSLLLPSTLGFSADELQGKLAERMPMQRTFLGLFDLAVGSPRITLDAIQQRVVAEFAIDLRTPLAPRGLPGSVQFSGVPRYDPATRSVMLDAARVDALHLDGLSRALVDRLNEMANLLAKELLDRRPLYTFKPEQLRWGGVPLTPRGVRIEGDRLLVDLARGDAG